MNSLMWHVFIQWLTSKDMLDEYMQEVINWNVDLSNIDNIDAAEFINLFPWGANWLDMNGQWEMYRRSHRKYFVRISREYKDDLT